MILRFSLPYRTVYGQRLAVCGSHPELGNWQLAEAAAMQYDEATTCWQYELAVADAAGEQQLSYKYLVLDDNAGSTQWEFGPNRTVAFDAAQALPGTTQRLHLADCWRAPAQPENELLTAAFTKALFRRPSPVAAAAAPATKSKKAKAPAAAEKATAGVNATVAPAAGETLFRILAPRVEPHQQLCILGSDPALGAWDNTKALVLSDAHYPTWEASVKLENPAENCIYKYAIWDAQAGHALDMEGGDNRTVPAIMDRTAARVFNDEGYRYADTWRGAGVALPYSPCAAKTAWAWGNSRT